MFSIIYRNVLWIAPVAIGLSIILLYAAITSLMRLNQAAHLFAVPVSSPQSIEFHFAGPVVLSIEGPRATMAFAKLKFHIQGKDSAQKLQTSSIWFRLRSSGLTTSKLEIQQFDVKAPGKYILMIEGLSGGTTLSQDYKIVFSKPHTFESIARILGIVFSGIILIASLVLFILRIVKLHGD